MIAGLKPYAAMKNSGLPWLGQVPEHWEMLRLRNAASIAFSGIDRNAAPNQVEVKFVGTDTVYGSRVISASTRLSSATATDQQIARFRLLKNDIVLTKDSVVPTRIAIPAIVVDELSDLTICGYHLALLRAYTRLNPRYLHWVLQSDQWANYFVSEARGTTIIGLSFDSIASAPLPLPPVPEQRAIVRFLGDADRRIRRCILAKQQLIKLLEEQKHAIIHRAVTRGVNSHVRFKPSGVEWLGDVPEHWEVRRNGRLFSQRNETGFADLPILEVSLRTGVRVRDFENSDRKQVMTDRDKYKRTVVGDIAYNMMRMWQGAVGLTPADGLISPAYVVAKPLPGTESRYFVRLFRTAAYMAEVDKFSRGIVKDRNRLYWEDFKRMPSCYPPPREQVEIADAIDDRCGEVDAGAYRVRQEIALLREYRTRLIADVVTGKADVREAALLPDEGEEPEPLDEADASIDGEEDAAEGLDTAAEETEV